MNEKVKVKKPILKKWWFWAAIVVIIVAIYGTNNDSVGKEVETLSSQSDFSEEPNNIANSQSTETEAAEATAKPTPKATEAQANIELGVGDTVDLEDGLSLTVHAVTTNKTGFIEPDGIYYIIDCTFNNQGAEDVSISTLMEMYVKDDEGTKYSVSIGAETKGSIDGAVPAGEKLKGEVAFDIPEDAENLYFYYEPFSWTTSKRLKWKISE